MSFSIEDLPAPVSPTTLRSCHVPSVASHESSRESLRCQVDHTGDEKHDCYYRREISREDRASDNDID
jgi:hypothetical protein